MMARIEERFAHELRSALRLKFRHLPPAAFVSNQFNRRIRSGNGVSSETVRRWMRGLSMPSYEHLELLVGWLSLDMSKIIKPGDLPAVSATSLLEEVFTTLHPELQENLLRFMQYLPKEAPPRIELQFRQAS